MLFLIVLAPLVGAIINGIFLSTNLSAFFFGEEDKENKKRIIGIIGCASVLVSAIISTLLFIKIVGYDHSNRTIIETAFEWIPSGDLSIKFELLFDSLSSVMALMVTWVGFLIHVYSVGYMYEDKSYGRYFTFLNLFVFFMLLLVLGNNFPLMFVGWEGVGLASYLLIGFWYEDSEKAYAGRKAFIINRIGDLGFILAIFLIFIVFGSLNYQDVFSKLSDSQFLNTVSTTTVTVIALLLFVGAVGKSAQFPLYVWLPDAMAGPTAVSALIHAATMVTAGIYMTARCNLIYTLSPTAQYVVLTIATLTAFLAAAIAITQTDIKKVLAYSTVSQLGYMFMAIGVGAYVIAIFHLVTHAFFKALLFLGSGSVIHALSGEQDIRKMGGLRKHIPVTSITFLIGTLAIAGVPLLSGFFSKDEILGSVYHGGFSFHWFVGLFTAVLTAFYMMRLYILTFEGKSRVNRHVESHIHESPPTMTIPLILLAVLSIIGGYIGFPEFMAEGLGLKANNLLESYLSGTIYALGSHGETSSHHLFGHWYLVAFSIAAAFAGILVAFIFYYFKPSIPLKLSTLSPFSSFTNWSYAKFYVDEFYQTVFIKPFNHLSNESGFFDKFGVDGLVNGTGDIIKRFGSVIQSSQVGLLRIYATVMAFGVVIIFALVFLR